MFTSVNATSLGGVNTVVHGVNDNGDIVGDYTDSAGKSHAFLRSKGVFQTTDFPLTSGFAQASGRGIADTGAIVGEYADEGGQLHGFVRSPTGIFHIYYRFSRLLYRRHRH
jgi:probable HAF family extracellular repeat protein